MLTGFRPASGGGADLLRLPSPLKADKGRMPWRVSVLLMDD